MRSDDFLTLPPGTDGSQRKYDLVVTSKRRQSSGTNNADFVTGGGNLDVAHGVHMIQPTLVTFQNNFTTTPSIVYVQISSVGEGNLTDSTSGAVWDCICPVPVDVNVGETVVWEPPTNMLHAIITTTARNANRTMRVRLYDQELQQLVLPSPHHVTVVLSMTIDKHSYT